MGVLYANYYYGSTFVQKTVGRFDFHQPASDVCIADESQAGDGYSFVAGLYGKLILCGGGGVDGLVQRLFFQCLGT